MTQASMDLRLSANYIIRMDKKEYTVHILLEPVWKAENTDGYDELEQRKGVVQGLQQTVSRLRKEFLNLWLSANEGRMATCLSAPRLARRSWFATVVTST